jgi:hypothetical protein
MDKYVVVNDETYEIYILGIFDQEHDALVFVTKASGFAEEEVTGLNWTTFKEGNLTFLEGSTFWIYKVPCNPT